MTAGRIMGAVIARRVGSFVQATAWRTSYSFPHAIET
jgi:hypothetical protein